MSRARKRSDNLFALEWLLIGFTCARRLSTFEPWLLEVTFSCSKCHVMSIVLEEVCVRSKTETSGDWGMFVKRGARGSQITSF